MLIHTHQKEHALLVALPGVFQKTSMSDELAAGLDQGVKPDDVSLQFAQRGQIFRVLQRFAHRRHQLLQGIARRSAICAIRMVWPVMREKPFQQRLILK